MAATSVADKRRPGRISRKSQLIDHLSDVTGTSPAAASGLWKQASKMAASMGRTRTLRFCFLPGPPGGKPA
ncbi:hypothetical protein V5799_024676 [Amblyomma americanum]|uniref:Uncharacterized protein n=1 Tax=Amblyomma americanum TaxID=6943 RepID=A0AAQ4EBD2_AMBAM